MALRWFRILVFYLTVPRCSGWSEPGAGGVDRHPDNERVAVDREDFREKLRGKKFHRWRDFKDALGKDARLEPEVGGEVRLQSGLSLAFVVIVNVIVWAVVALVINTYKDYSSRVVAWAVFCVLVLYGVGVFVYCKYAYSDPSKRLVTNFLFGMVPLAVSAASYVLALLVLDLVRSVTSEEGFDSTLISRCRPWEESFAGRLIFFLAVWPGMAMSVYLGNTVSTGFEANATHFDILSLCLFIDVGRFCGHFSYLVARTWSIGKDPSSLTSRPGLAYVFLCLCLAWYYCLARLEAGNKSVIVGDPTKTYTLCCLTSFVFFPLSIYLTSANLFEFFEQFETQSKCIETFAFLLNIFCIALFMMGIAVIFDAIEPNLMGIGALLYCVFYAAARLSFNTVDAGCNLWLFVIVMMPLAALAFGAISLAQEHAAPLRVAVLAALAP